MAITRFESTDFTNKKISELSNTPNIDGMSANNLKARFDAMPQQIADLLNTRLIDILNSTTDGSSGADNIASTTIEGIVGTTVQAIMESLASAISGHTTDISGLVKSVTYDGATGVFTITKFDNTYTTIDTPLEKVVTNFRYDQATESLILTYPDGTEVSISLASFISEYDFLDSASIKFTVSNHKVTANLDSSYYDTLEGFKNSASASATNASTYANDALGYKNTASQKATEASNSATSASGSATSASGSATASNTNKLIAEGWAVGKQNGEDVPSSSPYYHNNAKYYAEQAQPQGTMLKGVYDTHNKNEDIFDYVDSHASNIPIQPTAPTDGSKLWIDTSEPSGESGTVVTKIGNAYGEVTLDDDLEVVNNKIQVKKSYITLTSSILDGIIHILKYGKIVNIRFSGSINSLSTGEVILATLPQGYAPDYVSQFSPVLEGVNGFTHKIQLNVGTNGAISAYNYGSAITSTNVFRFVVTYITA